jgi:hypothetical protein
LTAARYRSDSASIDIETASRRRCRFSAAGLVPRATARRMSSAAIRGRKADVGIGADGRAADFTAIRVAEAEMTMIARRSR